MNSKAKGSRAEHRCMRILEAAGYACTRAAASLGVFDVVGVGPLGTRLVQVKSNRWPGTLEMEAIELFPVHAMCTKEVWRFNDRQRVPMIKVIGKGEV